MVFRGKEPKTSAGVIAGHLDIRPDRASRVTVALTERYESRFAIRWNVSSQQVNVFHFFGGEQGWDGIASWHRPFLDAKDPESLSLQRGRGQFWDWDYYGDDESESESRALERWPELKAIAKHCRRLHRAWYRDRKWVEASSFAGAPGRYITAHLVGNYPRQFDEALDDAKKGKRSTWDGKRWRTKVTHVLTTLAGQSTDK